jgi:hypothetical protein
MSSEVSTELSCDDAVRALDLQERGVEQLRARTGTLLAASSLTASFLGAQTIQHTGGLQTLGSLALVSLAASIVLRIYVLLPKRGFVFSVNAARMYETLFEIGEDEEGVLRRLIYWLEEYRQANEAEIEDLGRYSGVPVGFSGRAGFPRARGLCPEPEMTVHARSRSRGSAGWIASSSAMAPYPASESGSPLGSVRRAGRVASGTSCDLVSGSATIAGC